MTIVYLAFMLLFLADALRLRGRVAALTPLAPSDEPVSEGHRFIVAAGVTLDEATRRAASAHARAVDLEALDLVPADLASLRLLGLVALIDPARYRGERFGAGLTAEHAVLVTTRLAERAGVDIEARPSPVEMVRLVSRLKKSACLATDAAIAPDLRAVTETAAQRLATVRARLGNTAVAVLVGQAGLVALLLAGIARAPAAATAALLAFHLQPILALAGQAARPRDLVLVALLRAPLELVAIARLAFTGPPRATNETKKKSAEQDPVEARRPAYESLLRDGVDRFFEPRAERCPVCDGSNLAPHLATVDLLQHKPGRFTLERCAACAHVFQNPRLSIEGLDFYYRDFYDGLGEEGLEFIFGYATASYEARARLIAAASAPTRLLDVGCGHGHFSCTARAIFPEARLDGLDLSESVEEAARRGWIDHGHRGLFTALAPSIRGAYDAVTMSHYLEHTLDQRAEIRAAHTALREGGVLMIEVPDPDCVLGSVMGQLWLPWFQPQHLHLLSTRNADRLLREEGFQVVTWHREEAHQRVDFFLAAMLLFGFLAPPPDQPWRPRASMLDRAYHKVIWSVAIPIIALSRLLDVTLGPLLGRASSNTYRVLARRLPDSATPSRGAPDADASPQDSPEAAAPAAEAA
jgi:SAM-dependent methyltransferase